MADDFRFVDLTPFFDSLPPPSDYLAEWKSFFQSLGGPITGTWDTAHLRRMPAALPRSP